MGGTNSERSASYSVGPIEQAARDVSNALLSRTGAALMTGNFEEFAPCFDLPTTVETFEGVKTFSTLAELETVFWNMHRYLIRQSVTDFCRNCLLAEYVDPNTIKATHESRLMNGSRLVQEPYPCLSTLRRIDDRWKVVHSSYALVNAPLQNKIILGELNNL